MQATVRKIIDNHRVPVTVRMRCLMERLAKAAGMNGWLAAAGRRLTLDGGLVTELAGAFVAENMKDFEDEELLDIFSWYARLRFDTEQMACQLIRHFRK